MRRHVLLAALLGAPRRRGGIDELLMTADWKDDHDKRVALFPDDVRVAHQHSINHRAEILASARCGCFYCCSTFAPATIIEWTDEAADGQGQTALCPRCGIDSVIGDRSGFDPSAEFLAKMKSYWFRTR